MEAKKTPIIPQILAPVDNPFDFSSNILPTMIIPLMAFVTLIKGVCKAAVTFQMTMYPMKMDKIKMNILFKRRL